MTALRRVPLPPPLRVLFVVQGEGRGHLTQALAAAEMLRAAGHVVVGALVGTSARRAVPAFFRAGIGAPVATYASPNFVSGTDGAIRPAATLARALRDGPSCSASLQRLGDATERTEPDVIVNFYEALVGTYALLRTLDVPVVAVGHQFAMGLPGYPLAGGQLVQRAALAAYTRLVGARATVRVALSLQDVPGAPEARIRVVPPLLRRQLFGLTRRAPAETRLLVYLMEPALGTRLAAWSDCRPDVRVDCFSDARPHLHSERLEFHALSGDRFLEHMATASGVVCTAGFESVSEAMWLGTPALMLPVPNHYEQRCNARDAQALGAGTATDGRLDQIEPALDAFADALANEVRASVAPFRSWVDEAPQRFVGCIEAAVGRPPRPVPRRTEAPAHAEAPVSAPEREARPPAARAA